ncbi:MAG: hypothetical protein KHY44_00025 [Clostridiales bacterium]|nr:hypothetical protein [Clostridiales bacterium]
MRELGELEITKAAKEAEEIILIISMVGSLSISVEAVRIRVIEFITEVFEKFTSISYQKHEGEHSDKIEVSYLPQYIPKGFEVTGEEQIFFRKSVPNRLFHSLYKCKANEGGDFYVEKSIILPYMDSINNATVGLKITNSGEVQIRSSIVGYSSHKGNLGETY